MKATTTATLHPDLPAGVADLAAALAAGALSAEEATRAYLARIAAADGRIKSFIRVDAEGALAAARAADARRARGEARGPLDGVPIGVKDNIDMAGLPTTGGIAHYRDNIAREDAEVVAHLRSAGAVFLGKLNMHEGALGATNDNPWFGRCENPRLPGHTPGGSSGGSAAAVAAGFCAAALGTDTMGSVRVPAAYCGVVGCKPPYGAISARGVMPLSWTLDHVGVLALSVEDARVVAAAARSPPAAPPAAARLDAVTLGIPALASVELGSEVAQAFQAHLEGLRRLGARVVELDFGAYEWTRLRREGLLVSEIEAAAVHGEAITRDPDGFSAEFRAMLAFGAQQTAVRTAQAYKRVRDAGGFVRARLTEVDALLLPTTPQASFACGAPVPANQADLTALANFAGVAAWAYPLAQGASAQCLVPSGRDDAALAEALCLPAGAGAPGGQRPAAAR